MTQRFDVAIVGSGTTGLAAAAAACAQGRSVVIFESHVPGGSTFLTEDVPFLALRDVGRQAAGASPMDLHNASTAPSWWAAAREHADFAVTHEASRRSREVIEAKGITLVEASAHFIAPDRLEAGGRAFAFKRAVIATGSGALIPDIPGLSGSSWMAPATLLAQKQRPGHLVVLGGEAPALELAQVFARLGSRVTLMTRAANILADWDPELRIALRNRLRQDGVEFSENSPPFEIGQSEDGPTIRMAGSSIAATHLVVAHGRAPRLEALDLAIGNVARNEHGVVVDNSGRSISNHRVSVAGSASVDPQPHHLESWVDPSRLWSGSPLFSKRMPPPYGSDTVRVEPELARLRLQGTSVSQSPETIRRYQGSPPTSPPARNAFLAKMSGDHRGRMVELSLHREGAIQDALLLQRLAIASGTPLMSEASQLLQLRGPLELD